MKAQAVSARVERAKDRRTAVELILKELADEGVREEAGALAVWAGGSLVEGFDTGELEGRQPGLHFEVTRERAAAARVGISQAEWAIASTGSVLGDATYADVRLVSTLPWLHIVVVPEAGLVADLGTALSKVDPKRAPYLAAITGPSRTADIERVLTIGVHGPEKLLIVMVEEWA